MSAADMLDQELPERDLPRRRIIVRIGEYVRSLCSECSWVCEPYLLDEAATGVVHPLNAYRRHDCAMYPHPRFLR